MSVVHNGREEECFTTILALRKGLKALFEAVRGSSIKVLGRGVAGMLRESPSHSKAHVKLSSRRVLKGETKVPVKIRAQMPTKIHHLGLVVERKMCSSMLLIKCCFREEEEQIRAGGKTNVWGNFMQEVYLCAGRRCWTICARAKVKSGGCSVLQGLQSAKWT